LLDDERNSPIHISSREGYIEILKYLLEHNPQANLKNISCHSPLELAKNDKISQVLQDYLNEIKYKHNQKEIQNTSDTLSKNLLGKFNNCIKIGKNKYYRF
jgi:ankyrin repeat protein